MTNKEILLLLPDSETDQFPDLETYAPSGYQVTRVSEWESAKTKLEDAQLDLIITIDQLEGRDTYELVSPLIQSSPLPPVILLSQNHSADLSLQALRRGFSDYLQPPVSADDLQQAIHRALERRAQIEQWARLSSQTDTDSIGLRVSGLEAVQQIGRQVTSHLNIDSVLIAVVDAAVELTGAEEGSLLLLDEKTGELYMRAGRNFKEDFVKTFRIPTQDSLAGEVIRTGNPLLIEEGDTPQKIKSAYLVHTIIYVPLIVKERVIGVLEVDNRQTGKTFNDYHVALVSALADYAAIAIENARLFSFSEHERDKLESILTNIEEAVIITDQDHRIILVNRKARESFGIIEEHVSGKRAREVIHHQELLEVLMGNEWSGPSRLEINLDDSRVLNAQLTPIAGIGLVIAMQDITHLKELDRIKSDFVNTVSHDLRSPLTAILGYVELIERVAPISEQQREFIHRIQISVNNITALINDLLDLGRIEAGFDARNEIVPLSAIIHYAVDGLLNRSQEKSQEIILDVPDMMPHVLGNPVRLQQMVSNLLSNAIKYTPHGGVIRVKARAEGGQIIIQILDNGPGIPPADQPYIFDKFYRASNVSSDIPGTGLGLAIVKSIVENHLGRIWVESVPGNGATFTVVLPTTDREL